MSLGTNLTTLNHVETPSAPQRWVNEWDNLDGTIERGYGGRSIFFKDNHVLARPDAAKDYARLLASIGINACVVNNVNANPRVMTDGVPAAARAAVGGVPPVGRPDGARGRLQEPEDDRRSRHVRPAGASASSTSGRHGRTTSTARCPDLGGFVLKADSEGRLGPSAYGRTHADAANVIARALKPHGGLFFYRGFVYDHHMDWRNLKNDRARAAYDNFHDLDGQFDDNVILQIKHGPIDFQVREPGVAAVRRAEEDQPGHRAADHAGVLRPAAARRVPRADVEGSARFRPAGGRSRDAGEGDRQRARSGGRRRIRRRVQRRRLDRHWLGHRPVAGQPLRLRPSGLESGPDRHSRSPTSGRG